jgi:hypothetical protein
MTDFSPRTTGFTSPIRAPRRLLHGIALPELIAVLTLVVSTAALLTALSLSVAATDKRAPVPVSGLSQTHVL